VARVLLRLSNKEIAAVAAVLDIAVNGGGGLVQSADITRRQGIPPRYLEPILQRLGRAGILVGIRGPSGGYRLAREQRRITVWDLVSAIRGAGEAPVAGARDGPRAALERLLAEIEGELRQRLDAVTVEDLCWPAERPGAAATKRATADFTI
jgi:Rrf2 family protein